MDLIAQLRSSAVVPTDKPRCPYCIEHSDFKRLSRFLDLLTCERCGHATSTQNDFVCPCPKCQRLRSFRSSVTPIDEMQERSNLTAP